MGQQWVVVGAENTKRRGEAVNACILLQLLLWLGLMLKRLTLGEFRMFALFIGSWSVERFIQPVTEVVSLRGFGSARVVCVLDDGS